MQVRAIRQGYYGLIRRKPGAVFELVEVKGFKGVKGSKKLEPVTLTPEDQFSSDWMEKVKAGEPVKAPEPEADGRKPFGAKKGKAVGYSASLESDSKASSTGDQKVI